MKHAGQLGHICLTGSRVRYQAYMLEWGPRGTLGFIASATQVKMKKIKLA